MGGTLKKVTLVNSKSLMTTVLAKSLSNSLDVWTNVVSSPLVSLSSKKTWKTGSETCCPLVNSVTSCWPPLLESWTTKRPVAKRSEERFSVSFIKPSIDDKEISHTQGLRSASSFQVYANRLSTKNIILALLYTEARKTTHELIAGTF